MPFHFLTVVNDKPKQKMLLYKAILFAIYWERNPPVYNKIDGEAYLHLYGTEIHLSEKDPNKYLEYVGDREKSQVSEHRLGSRKAFKKYSIIKGEIS